MTVRLLYVDDSGASQTRYVTYSWLEMAVEDWNGVLRRVIDWRRQVWRNDQIAVETELHATKFLNGRGNPSTDPTWDVPAPGEDWEKKDVLRKRRARSVGQDACRLLGQLAPTLTAGTYYRQLASSRGAEYAAAQEEVYAAMINDLDRRLHAAGDLGIVIMDGNGTNPMYRRVHRKLRLADRAIIEDPGFQPAHESQLVQLADLVAYVSYQHLLGDPDKLYAQQWFTDHLSGIHDQPPTAV